MRPHERRKSPRTAAQLFAVFKRIVQKKEAFLPHVGYTRDISTEGVYFYTTSKATVGDHILLTIHFSSDWAGENPPKLESEGRVLRIEEDCTVFPVGNFNGVAIRLIEELAVSA